VQVRAHAAAPVEKAHQASVAGHGEVADGDSHDYVCGAAKDVAVLRVLQRHVGPQPIALRGKGNTSSAVAQHSSVGRGTGDDLRKNRKKQQKYGRVFILGWHCCAGAAAGRACC
jgi:hypothetical protein